MICTYFRKGSF